MIKHKGDVCIVGLGSGGIGAALACIDHGLKVIAIERESSPGGNSVFNGVPDYPAGPGEMYNKWLYQTLHEAKGDNAIGMSVAMDAIYSVGSSPLGYDQSLFRYAPVKNYSPSTEFEDLKEISPTIIFRADAFSDHVKSSLQLKRNYDQVSGSVTVKTNEASEVVKFDAFQVSGTISVDQLPKDLQPEILYETTLVAVHDVADSSDGLRIQSVKCTHDGNEVLVEASIFIDCSANLVLAQALRKHPVCVKSSSPEMFMYVNGDEVEYAKVKTGGSKWPGLNGTSQVYRVTYSTNVNRPAKKSNSLLGSFITGWDKQFYNITPLNMAIDGAEFFENQSDLEIYYQNCKISAIYHWVKKAYDPPFNQYMMFVEEQSPTQSFQEFWDMFDQDVANNKGLHLSEIISDFNNSYSLQEQGVALKQTGELIASYANSAGIYPLPGVREYFRLGSKYILQLEDQKNLIGLNKQYDPGASLCYIGRVEQPTDYHKGIVEFEEGKDTEKTGVPNDKVKKPYLVPYECLISSDFANFMVACRGAGFDQATAASARLSKNMMGLGHATGYAAALALARFSVLGQKLDVRDVPEVNESDIGKISAASERYSLDYPLEEHMRIAFGANSWPR